MRFIHIADMHFDMPFTLLSHTSNLGEIRRLDQRKALKKVIEYIKENQVPYLFIAGDLYEQEYIRQSTIEYINTLFAEIPTTKIYIAPGNHDPYLKNSYYATYAWEKNVTIFQGEIQKIEEPEFNLYGYGFTDFYCQNSNIEQIQLEDTQKINILFTHASLDGGYDELRNYNTLSSKKIKEIGFDYIALGHIHKRMQDKNVVYPGSTISLGFDELGEHGMLVGEINKQNLQLEFIPIDEKEFCEQEIDITQIQSIEELLEKIETVSIEEKKLYKVILTGKRKIEINTYQLYKKITQKNIIKIKDNTKLDYSLQEMANDYTLKGLFVKEMLEKLENKEIDKEIVEKAIEIGLEVL